MKAFLSALILLLFVGVASGANVTFGHATGGYISSAQSDALTITPTNSTDDVIFAIETFTSSAALNGTGCQITTGSGSLIADQGFSVSGSYGYGFYRVHNAGTSALDVQCSFSGTVASYAWLVDATTVGSFCGVSTLATGSVSPLLSNSLGPPSVNGAMFLAMGSTSTADTFGSWASGSATFTALGASRTSGPSASAAYLDQTTNAAVTAGTTLGSNSGWNAIEACYQPAGPSGPTALQAAQLFLGGG